MFVQSAKFIENHGGNINKKMCIRDSPSSNSLSSGQVLHCPYEADKAKLVIREMTDLLVLDLSLIHI